MDYIEARDAESLPGLRLALTIGVPGPWSQAAKFLFDYKQVPYVPVAQYASKANEDLVRWTGCRNAPVAVLDDEPGKTNWGDIITLADRICPERPLLPTDSDERVATWGLVAEIAAETGFGWTRRLLMRGPLPEGIAPPDLDRVVMDRSYGSSEQLRAQAAERVEQILHLLASRLHAQRARGSGYFVGSGVTAVDLYWAAFSQMLLPLPEADNPMPEWLRYKYTYLDATRTQGDHALLLAHRDMMFERHLSLPLDY